MIKLPIITHYAAITSLGTCSATCTALLSGKSGIVPGPTYDIAVPSAPFPDRTLRSLPEAVRQTIDPSILPDPATSVFIYTTAKGDLSSLSSPVFSEDATTASVSARLDEQAASICAQLDWHPARTMVVSCACASGAIGVEVARELLMDGSYTHAVLFGHDPISGFVLSGFHGLNALSPTGARPFDAARDGLTLGECAAFAVLSLKEPHKGDLIIAGAGSSNDANHRTGPSRDGAGLANAIVSSLKDAGLSADDVGAIKCHGTATPYNDAMEAKALTRIFESSIPPMVSTKGALGHMSGAGSLCEILLAAEFIKQKKIPPTYSFETSGVEEAVPVSSSIQSFNKPAILCLSAGFGGLNAAVIVSEAQ